MALPFTTVTNETITPINIPTYTYTYPYTSEYIGKTLPSLQINASDFNWIVLKESGEIVGIQGVNYICDTNLYFIPTKPASDEIDYAPMSLGALNAAYKMYTESVINFINADNDGDGGDTA